MMSDDKQDLTKIVGSSIAKGVIVWSFGLFICSIVALGLLVQVYSILSDANLGSSAHSEAIIWLVPVILFKVDPVLTIDLCWLLLSIYWITFFGYWVMVKTALNKLWFQDSFAKQIFENYLRQVVMNGLKNLEKWESGFEWAKIKIQLLKANAENSDKPWLIRKGSSFVIRRLKLDGVNLNQEKEDYAESILANVSQYLEERTIIVYWPYFLDLGLLITLFLISLFI